MPGDDLLITSDDLFITCNHLLVTCYYLFVADDYVVKNRSVERQIISAIFRCLLQIR